MTLVWVTGVSGVGKSTVHRELLRRGYASFDADEDGMSQWYDRSTGGLVPNPSERGDGWISQYAWCIVRDRVEKLAFQALDRPVFLGGAVENEADVWDLFDAVVCLVVRDDMLLRNRLLKRATNDFGKAPDELTAVLSWNRTIEERYRSVGATIIDASQPLSAVVNEVAAVGGTAGDYRFDRR